MNEIDEILKGEYSEEFDRKRKNRVAVSYYKYGPARKNFGEGRVDAIKTAELCLSAFEKDHNLEHLIDAANYLMFRYKYPLPGDIFVENYISGPKVVFKVEQDKERGWLWAKEMYLSDIQAMYDTKEEADDALKDWMKEQICFTNISIIEEVKKKWNLNR